MYPTSLSRSTPDFVYLSVDELAQRARSGSLQPDELLFDLERGEWSPAVDWPELRPYFPRSGVNWGAVGVGALAVLALGAWCASVSDADFLSWPEQRRSVFRRDQYRCDYCGRRVTSRTGHVDHKLPVCRGGTDDPANLVTACGPCNQRKGSRTALEFRFAELFG
jgi:hypothetical protein